MMGGMNQNQKLSSKPGYKDNFSFSLDDSDRLWSIAELWVLCLVIHFSRCDVIWKVSQIVPKESLLSWWKYDPLFETTDVGRPAVGTVT